MPVSFVNRELVPRASHQDWGANWGDEDERFDANIFDGVNSLSFASPSSEHVSWHTTNRIVESNTP